MRHATVLNRQRRISTCTIPADLLLTFGVLPILVERMRNLLYWCQLTSVALGTLVGAAVYKWLTETFGWWRLQIGRIESYIRRAKKR